MIYLNSTKRSKLFAPFLFDDPCKLSKEGAYFNCFVQTSRYYIFYFKKMKQSLYIPILIFLLTGCSDNKTSQSKDIRKVLSGEFAKLWVFKTSDSFDCHCYYTLIYKSGKMNYMVRDKFTGTFTNYFNELSGDNINNDKTWRYENDTLRLIGFPYQIRRISANLDTIVLTSNSEINNLSTYYLIDSRLIDFDRTSD